MYLKFLFVAMLVLQSSSPDKKALTQKYFKAFNDHDVKTLKSILHPLCILTSISGGESTRSEIIEYSNDKLYDVETTEEIINMEEVKKQVWVTIEIQGEYLANIGAKYPLFIRRFKFKNDKIFWIKSDSLPGYAKGLKEVKKCATNFVDWHRREYKTNVPDSLVLERSRVYYQLRIKKE